MDYRDAGSVKIKTLHSGKAMKLNPGDTIKMISAGKIILKREGIRPNEGESAAVAGVRG